MRLLTVVSGFKSLRSRYEIDLLSAKCKSGLARILSRFDVEEYEHRFSSGLNNKNLVIGYG